MKKPPKDQDFKAYFKKSDQPEKYQELKESLVTDIVKELSYQKIVTKKVDEYVE